MSKNNLKIAKSIQSTQINIQPPEKSVLDKIHQDIQKKHKTLSKLVTPQQAGKNLEIRLLNQLVGNETAKNK